MLSNAYASFSVIKFILVVLWYENGYVILVDPLNFLYWYLHIDTVFFRWNIKVMLRLILKFIWKLSVDASSNFGFDMVRTSNEKLIKAKDVLSCGSPSILVMETALITLAHLALYSEEIEIEVYTTVFLFKIQQTLFYC